MTLLHLELGGTISDVDVWSGVAAGPITPDDIVDAVTSLLARE